MPAKQPEVLPITTAQYPTRARRPSYSCLDTSRLRADFEVELPDWRQALAQVLDIAAS
jgi:dTDP-4-dehydrorhamnose reductase